MLSNPIPRALTIAGSDSSAGAGIQADLKTFAALGVYGLSVLTAITAQNTLGIRATDDVAPALVEAQMDAVLEDVGADVAKTGMLASSAVIEVVVRQARKWGLRLVVDPVMVATSGTPLLRSEAVTMLRTELLPLAEVVTPNLPEAEALTSLRVESLDDMRAAASAIFAMGPQYVVVKGGHRGEGVAPTDVFFDGERFVELRAERVEGFNTHGTGCTFSAAIAAFLARGLSAEEAVKRAKHYITGAIRSAPGLGHGYGPVGHFWQWEQRRDEEYTERSI